MDWLGDPDNNPPWPADYASAYKGTADTPSYDYKPSKRTYTPDERNALIRMVYGEAGSPEEYGPVASTLINRSAITGRSLGDEFAAPHQYESYGRRNNSPWDLSPDSRTYKQIAAAVDPYLTGETDPLPYTHFYAPKLQADLGRSAPSWDNGKGVDIGQSRFFNLPYGGGASRMALGAPPSPPPTLASTLQSGSPMPGYFGDDIPDFNDELAIKVALQKAQQLRQPMSSRAEGTPFGAFASWLNTGGANNAEARALEMSKQNSDRERELMQRLSQSQQGNQTPQTQWQPPWAAKPPTAPPAAAPGPVPVPGIEVAQGATPANPAGGPAAPATIAPPPAAPTGGSPSPVNTPGGTPTLEGPRKPFTQGADIFNTPQSQQYKAGLMALATRPGPIGDWARGEIKFMHDKDLQFGMIREQQNAQMQAQMEQVYLQTKMKVAQAVSSGQMTPEEGQRYLATLGVMGPNNAGGYVAGVAGAPAAPSPSVAATSSPPMAMPPLPSNLPPGAVPGAAPAPLPNGQTQGVPMIGAGTIKTAAPGTTAPPVPGAPAPDASPAPGEPKTEDDIEARDLSEMRQLQYIHPDAGYDPDSRLSPRARDLKKQIRIAAAVDPKSAEVLQKQLEMDPTYQQNHKFQETAGEENAKSFSATLTGMRGSQATWGQQVQNFKLIDAILADPDHGSASGSGQPINIAARRAIAMLGINPKAAANSETLNMALARVMAEQVASLRTFAKSTGGDMGRVFARMIDLEEAALPNIHDSAEGIRQKVAILRNAGQLMIRWGKYANVYAYNNGGTLDERFMHWINDKIERAELPLKSLEEATGNFEHRGSKGDAEKILKGEVPGAGSAPVLHRTPDGRIAEKTANGWDTDTPAAKAAQAAAQAAPPLAEPGRSGVPQGAQLQPRSWIDLIHKGFGTDDPDQIARQRKRAGLPPVQQPPLLPPT